MTEQFIQFRVKGQKGDENIEVVIGDKLFKFDTIGTSFSNNNMRVRLDSSNPGNVTVRFNNGGSGNHEKIVPAKHRRCTRRWGKKRCSGVDKKSYIQKTPWTRMVYIEKFEADVSQQNGETQNVLSDLIEIANNVAQIKTRTGRMDPDVIT